MKRDGSQDKVHSCKHPVNQQGVVLTGDTYLNRGHEVLLYFYSFSLPTPQTLKDNSETGLLNTGYKHAGRRIQF